MSSTNDDAHLLAAWHDRRDAASFRILCDRHQGLVQAVCRRQGSPDIAEAVQAVFLVLARRAGAVPGASLGGWLTITAQRVTRDQRLAVARRQHHEQEAAVEQARQHAADGADPSWDEARQHLDTALASLSVGRREAVLRFYLEGKPQTQVAAELGCSVDAVKTRVHEGLEHLRVFYARKGLALGAVALASGLASEATASEPALVATCVQTVLTPATAPGAAALAHGVVTAMIIKTATLIAAGLVLAGSCLTAALVAGAEPAPTPMAVPAPPTPVPAAPAIAKPESEIDILVLNLNSSNGDLVRESLYILTKRQDPSGKVKALALLKSDDNYIWFNAAIYLGALNESQAIPYLIKGLKHPASRSHDKVAALLASMTGRGFGKNQEQWMEWWRKENPNSRFVFSYPDYEKMASNLDENSEILINHVVDPLRISHLGPQVRLIGIKLKNEANPTVAVDLLRRLLESQVVQLKFDQGPKLDEKGARRAFVYWTMSSPSTTIVGVPERLGRPGVPFTAKTLINTYLLESGLYEIDINSVQDETMIKTLQMTAEKMRLDNKPDTAR